MILFNLATSVNAVRAFVVAVCLLLGAPLLAQTYTITDLGTLPGDISSYASGINASGQVVGYSSDGGYSRAFVWQDGTGMQDLGALPGDFSSVATSINASGQVVGYSFLPGSDDDLIHAFLWENGQMTDLGTLGGDSVAWGTNASGQVVGNSYLPGSNGPQHAFLSQGGQMSDLGTLGGNYSSARAINDSGQVVGRSALPGSNGPQHAFVWQDGQMSDLGTLGGSSSVAFGINASGQVVGESNLSSGLRHAFVWQDGIGMQDLGTLPSDTSSYASAINASGQVVGTSFLPVISGPQHAFVWQDGVMRDLNDLIPLGSGWELREARAINDTGQIVGGGRLNGEARAFLLTPLARSVPLFRLDSAPFYFLSADQSEHDFLVSVGWTPRPATGRVYNQPDAAPGLTPLFRLYSPFSGDHFYTTNAGERDAVVAGGFYNDEGVACYVFAEPGAGRKPLLRAYNPDTSQHLFTGDQAEYDALGSEWSREGTAAYLLE